MAIFYLRTAPFLSGLKFMMMNFWNPSLIYGVGLRPTMILTKMAFQMRVNMANRYSSLEERHAGPSTLISQQ